LRGPSSGDFSAPASTAPPTGGGSAADAGRRAAAAGGRGHRPVRAVAAAVPARGGHARRPQSSGVITSNMRTTRCTPEIWRAMVVRAVGFARRHAAHQVDVPRSVTTRKAFACRSEASTKEARTLPVM
jgi:hypothetical protein